jgi:hypothetical protein
MAAKRNTREAGADDSAATPAKRRKEDADESAATPAKRRKKGASFTTSSLCLSYI